MRRFYSALKYVCILALVISLIALVSVVAYVLIKGVDKISLDLLFGDYKNSPSILPAFIGTLQLVGISAQLIVPPRAELVCHRLYLIYDGQNSVYLFFAVRSEQLF